MTKEDIIKLAQECGHWSGQTVELNDVGLERFAAIIRADERERCATVCCDMIDAEYETGKVDHHEMAWTQACANAIRARSEK